MKYTSITYKAVAYCLLLFSTSIISAEEKVNFKDETTAKKILLNKKWLCGVGDGGGMSGSTVWKFEEVNGNRVSGTVSAEFCGAYSAEGTPSRHTSGTFKGKLKKDRLKYSVKLSGGNCTNFSGNLIFTREDENFRAEGKYSRTASNKGYQGTAWCYTE